MTAVAPGKHSLWHRNHAPLRVVYGESRRTKHGVLSKSKREHDAQDERDGMAMGTSDIFDVESVEV